MNKKGKTLGLVLASTAIGLFILWTVFLCLRYALFQKSYSVLDGIVNNLKGIGASFVGLSFHAPLNELLWKGLAWLVALADLIFVISLLVSVCGAKANKGLGILGMCAMLLAALPALDFIANSGNYLYYLNRFMNVDKNTFFATGILGFLGLGALIIAAAIVAYIFIDKALDAKEPEAAPAE